MIELHLPRDVVIGGGAAESLAERVSGLGVERPLVVSDDFLLSEGPAGAFVEQLRGAGLQVSCFGDVQPDPTVANVEGALAAIREHGADGVVAIGGGSPMDTAKVASVLAANDGCEMRDFAGYDQVPGPGLPLVAVPTTAGTGSEEARLIGRHIRRAIHYGKDEEAREGMMIGATLAGAAFSNASVALVHGMSRPIGAHFHLPHGLSNALLLPAVTRFSVSGAPDRYATIAREMGLADGDVPDDAACDALVGELDALNRELEIPSLSGAGAEREHFERVVEDMAQAALDSGSPGFNPRPATRDEIVALYHEAW